MNRLSQIRRRLAVLFRREQFQNDLEEEMRAHLEMQAEENEANGMDADEARYAARRQFGNATLLRETSTETWGWPAIESCARDVKLAVRALRRNPAFTSLAVLTLALGIGANTAVFSVVQGVLLRPLPFRDPGRLVMVWEQRPKRGEDRVVISAPEFAAFQMRSSSFESMAAIHGGSATLALAGEPTQVPGWTVSADFFKTLGVAPALGRVFSSEEQRSGHRVAVLGDALAKRLGGDMVGKTVRLDGELYVVIGVMPPEFSFPDGSDIWRLIAPSRLAASDDNHNFRMIARLKSGATATQAQSEVQTIALPFQQEYAASLGTGMAVVPLREEIIGHARHALLALLGVVACLLLIACANVANLSLSRIAGRRREIALRLSLGASRWRVVRLLLAEGAVLAFAGGALGLVAAYWGVSAFVASNPIELPRVQEIAIDPGVLLFTFTVAVLTALLIGLIPALRVSRVDVNSALKQAEGNRIIGGFGRDRARSVLAVAQVALAIMMLTGAGLLLRSFVERITVPLGFRPEGMLGVELPWSARPRMDELLERIRAIPGVQAAGAATAFPHKPPGTSGGFAVEGQPKAPEEMPRAGKMVITPDFFRAAGVTLLKGRFMTEADRADTQPVAVISEALARRHFAGVDPIGKRIRWGGPWATVVGVVGDIKGFGIDGPPMPTIYLPRGQVNWNNYVYVVVRTTVPPISLAPTVRKEIRAWDKTILIEQLAPIEDMLSASVAVPRFYMLLVAAFAVIALAIAAVGVYGTLNYLVTQRTHEIGVRMALGAQPSDLRQTIVGQGLALILSGLAFGLAGAWALTRLLASLLFRVRPNDAATFIAASAVLIAVGLLACYLPARRATNIDPLEALRHE